MNSRFVSGWRACFCLFVLGGTAASAQDPAKVPEVPVARPVLRAVVDYEVFAGRTEAATRVDLRPRVTGYLLKAPFQEGAEVKQGDVLFEIDARLHRAELDKADAALVQAEARLKLAEANQKRVTDLVARGVAPKEDLDKAVAERANAEAGVHLAKAGCDVARLNLEYTRVLAPVSGHIGRRLVDPGNLVKGDETLLATIVTQDPLYVFFDVDERTFLQVMQSRRQGLKGEKLPVAIALANEVGFPHLGAVDFIDNQVNPETGTIRMRAVLANKDKRLAPGMFVRARLPLSAPFQALLLPDQAVMAEDGARFVFIVNDKDVLERRAVKLGQHQDGLRVVTAGLKEVDRVVVGRLSGLRPGMTVRPRLVPVERERGKQGDEETGRKDSAPLSMSPATAGPGILVETVYPGANAAVVSETVRAPIEQQVGGIEKLRFMRSRCSSDGKYALALTFERGGDLHKMHMLTQNRVNLAVPLLPDVVKQAGVSVKQATSGVLLIVNLFSPDARYDQLYLSNYATIQIKDELARVSGVGEVTLIGPSDCSMRLWLDPDRLAARNLSASDVVRALREQNVQVGGQKLGQPPVPKGEGFQYTLNTLGRLTDPDQFAGIILKTDGEGRLVRLKDVAEVELGAGQRRSQGLLDGKPVVSLVIRPTGEVGVQKVGAALKKRLGGLRSRFPNGLEFAIAFDFTANHEAAGQAMAAEYLLLDLDFPRTLANERTDRVLSHCEKLLREVAGVEHVLALSENPFDLFGSGPCLLVRLTPAKQRGFSRDKIIETIRGRFGAIEEATMRIRDLSEPGSFPRCGYPIDVALYGPEPDRVREWAKTLGERLAQSKKLTDVWVNRDSAPRPQQFVDINREKAAMLGVSLEDVLTTLQVHAGGRDVSDFNRFGRTGRVVVQTAGGSGEWAKDLRKLKVRNTASQMIPLNALVTVHESDAPLVLDFLEGWPMVGITANPAPGVSVEQGRKLCEALADEVRNELGLAATYRLTWLQEIRRPK